MSNVQEANHNFERNLLSEVFNFQASNQLGKDIQTLNDKNVMYEADSNKKQ